MTDKPSENPSAPVAHKPTRAEELLLRWSWTERAVWTPRMLEALEQGDEERRKWHTLIDKVHATKTLLAAAQKVVSNRGAAGVDHVSTERFALRCHEEIAKLQADIRSGAYRPMAVRRVDIPKPGSTGTRPLGIPAVRDRVVQASIVMVAEPIFEREQAEHSYGFRPGRGCKDALRRVDELLKSGHAFVVDADLKSYFDTIPHDRLMDRLRERISDSSLLGLIEMFLKADVMKGMERWTPTSGAPQGAVLSPLLSNIYLNPLDHLMAQAGFEMTRYADDFVIQCRSAEEAQRALDMVRNWTIEQGLTLHPEKTKVVDARTEGFEFLGYRFVKGHKFPRDKSKAKLKESIRAKTKRTSGQSLPAIIASVNRTLRGWFEYFKHAHKNAMIQLDGWIRMRLRSVLRRRMGRHGHSRCLADHQRWRNVFFAKRGLFSLATARVLAVQSSRR